MMGLHDWMRAGLERMNLLPMHCADYGGALTWKKWLCLTGLGN